MLAYMALKRLLTTHKAENNSLLACFNPSFWVDHTFSLPISYSMCISSVSAHSYQCMLFVSSNWNFDSLQVMSVWPFKQMILRAQLRQGPTPAAQSANPSSGDQSTSSMNSQSSVSRQSSSSAQPMPTKGPQDLVQQKLSSDQSSAQSTAEPALQSCSDSAADPLNGAAQNFKSVSVQHAQSSEPRSQSSQQEHQVSAGATGNAPKEFLQTDYLFHFGDTTDIRKALEMPNRLTGYALSSASEEHTVLQFLLLL